MDDQASESRTRALRSERARATPFACPDVSPGVIAMTLAAVVQRLARWADIAKRLQGFNVNQQAVPDDPTRRSVPESRHAIAGDRYA
jgi:hypothetical protein